jgi:hypothetical protein
MLTERHAYLVVVALLCALAISGYTLYARLARGMHGRATGHNAAQMTSTNAWRASAACAAASFLYVCYFWFIHVDDRATFLWGVRVVHVWSLVGTVLVVFLVCVNASTPVLWLYFYGRENVDAWYGISILCARATDLSAALLFVLAIGARDQRGGEVEQTVACACSAALIAHHVYMGALPWGLCADPAVHDLAHTQ